ncbi:MAG: transcriptional regulator [Clostridiales bacterium]|nr:MAG: transcriptional regulator [Clostridiales bacterium]
MVFSSLIFLFAYLAITLVLYYAVPFKARNAVLFVVSLIFYGWGEPKYIVVMLFSILVAYIFGFFVGKYRESAPKKARAYLIVSIILNLSALLFFKYANFFIENLALIPGLGGLKPIEGLKLPVGISFYTFQIMSYTIDVYRGDARVQRRIVPFGAYVTLFPQLIAGPIVRYSDVDEQLTNRKETVDKFASGVQRFCAGLAKKVLLADTVYVLLGYYHDAFAFEQTVLGAWLIVILYTFQIYFDFSGYSDMAIGLGRMLGFEFLENFNYPYISKSITEFWRRWHISLSTWFREYVYIPLGGNRRGKLRQYRNIAVVWLLTGFWHGASWNFLLWGAYFCVLLIVEKLFLYKWLQKAPAVLAHLYTMFFVCISWLIFYFTDLGEGLTCLKAMFGVGVSSFATPTVVYDLLRYLPLLLICVLAATPLPKRLFDALKNRFVTMRYAQVLLIAGAFLVITAYLVDSTFSPFLYYRF